MLQEQRQQQEGLLLQVGGPHLCSLPLLLQCCGAPCSKSKGSHPIPGCVSLLPLGWTKPSISLTKHQQQQQQPQQLDTGSSSSSSSSRSSLLLLPGSR